MPILNRALGAPIVITRGRKGEQPDEIPGRIAGPTHVVFNDKGRAIELANVITCQPNLEGELYLAEGMHNFAFGWDRDYRVPMLDGTADEPLSLVDLAKRRVADAKAYFASRPKGGVVNLSEPVSE